MELPTTIWVWMDADGGIPESGEWCGDQIAEYDTEYVRADTIRQLQTDNAALRAEVERLREALEAMVEVSSRALGLSQQHADFKLYAMEPMHEAIATARAALGASSPTTPRGPIDWRDGPPPDELKDGRQVLLKLKDGFFAIATCYMKDHMGTNTSHWWNFSDHGVAETYVIAHCPVTP